MAQASQEGLYVSAVQDRSFGRYNVGGQLAVEVVEEGREVLRPVGDYPVFRRGQGGNLAHLGTVVVAGELRVEVVACQAQAKGRQDQQGRGAQCEMAPVEKGQSGG